ncbi:MAG: glycosyltransferase family 4 protein [Patescibacteria group bacterium]|nr:glycosyltransferase family 4 protein [Patescibacteria group bacterium]
MKLLIATGLYPPQLGGHAKYAKEIHDCLTARGHEVPVVVFGEVKHLPALVRHVVYLWRLFRHSRGCDAVLAFDTWSVGVPALIAARLRHLPLVVRVGGDFLWEQYVERSSDLVPLPEFYASPRALSLKERIIYRGTRSLTKRAAKLLFNSAWQRDIWVSAYHVPLSKTAIVENEYPGLVSAERASGRVFVAAGRAIRLKNIPVLEEAFARVKAKHPDIELDLRALPPEEHRQRLRGCYAVVEASVSTMNPNVIWEALSFGKPFICTTNTGIKDRLGDLGVFVDTTDRQALQKALEELLDEKTYTHYVEKIRAFPYTHTWEQITDEILAAISKKT